HKPGQLHGFMWVLDVTDMDAIEPVAAWDLTERACPWAGMDGVRFGAHQFREKLDSTLIYATWFAGGLRVIDVADPLHPVERAFYIPPAGKNGEPPQSNDVDLDANGLIYVLDRNSGLDILEMKL
ncbi:MAG: RNA polymerase subunit sigma-70, partial [Litoreibacter sp.]|nr:RNA polymerase subunit sigma-70 [Litoreibacter sp.]